MKLIKWTRFADALCLLGVDTNGCFIHFVINPGLIQMIRTHYKEDGVHITIASGDRYVTMRCTSAHQAEMFLHDYLDNKDDLVLPHANEKAN